MPRFDVITLFPEIVDAVCRFGVLSRGIADGLLEVRTHQLRDYTGGSPHPVDDDPYGGGPGMVMRADIGAAAIDAARKNAPAGTATIYLSPRGTPLTQAGVEMLAHGPGVILLWLLYPLVLAALAACKSTPAHLAANSSLMRSPLPLTSLLASRTQPRWPSA